ncbi:hypothetical protein BHE74_00013374, partial [Ensete ventricosum]
MRTELARRDSHLLPEHRRIVKLGEVHGEAATFPSLQQTILINAHSYPRLNLQTLGLPHGTQDRARSHVHHRSPAPADRKPFFLLNALNDHSPETFLRQIHRCRRSPNPKGELFSAEVSDHKSSNRMEK